MQTSKIKADGVYAIQRGAGLVRFAVDEIVTTKSIDRSVSRIVGWVVKDGTRVDKLTLDPSDIIGPYEEHAALVEQKRVEDENRKLAQEERERQARADRRALYKFVGAEVPRNEKDYHQLFRLSYSAVEIGSEGKQLLLQKIREITGVKVPELKIAAEG
jgi:hypothetical protein